jgi:ABC-type multidrug transport system permease subunit
MNVARPDGGRLGELGAELLAALKQVGSPIGLPYVNPIVVDWDGGEVERQVVVVEEGYGLPTAGPAAVQYYGLIDSNLVKNFRNRLTAAVLRLWDADLGGRAVIVEQHAWLPRDVSYNVYFGMALLPMTTFLAAAAIGAVLTAQEFELGTVVEYRLAPAPLGLILSGRLVRLVLSALLSAGILMLAVGLLNDAWPAGAWLVGLVLLPLAVMAGCLGILAGLLLRKTIPAFLVALVSTFVGWIMGSSFGLAAGFGVGYERISRLTPFTHAVELLFPRYYGAFVGRPGVSALVLVLMAAGMVALTALVYRRQILGQG